MVSIPDHRKSSEVSDTNSEIPNNCRPGLELDPASACVATIISMCEIPFPKGTSETTASPIRERQVKYFLFCIAGRSIIETTAGIDQALSYLWKRN
jgi:hypothetical protein